MSIGRELRGRDLAIDLVKDFSGFAAANFSDVILVLQQDSERVVDGVGSELNNIELMQGRGPIDRFGNAGNLKEILSA